MPDRGKQNLLGRAGLSPETRRLVAGALAEFLGTGMLCFLGCMGTLDGPLGEKVPHLQIGIMFGLVVGSIVACIGHVSGAHINPAVTVLSLIMRMVDVKTAAVYIVVQCIGAILGYGLLKVVTPCSLMGSCGVNITTAACATVPHPEISSFQALAAETVVTCLLLMLCCSVWDPRNAGNTDATPLKFGFLVLCVALAEGPYTGGSMNPARSLAPAVWTGEWTAHWVYWLGPIAAAVIVGYVWPLVFSPIEEDEVDDHADVPLTRISSDGKRRSKCEDMKGQF